MKMLKDEAPHRRCRRHRSKTHPKTAFKLCGFLFLHLSLLSLLLGLASSAPCPRETDMMGFADLNGSKDEYETYFAVDDDDLTKMVAIEYCVQSNSKGEPEHFRGFKPEIYSPVSGTSYQVFGDMSGSDKKDKCFRVKLEGEMMYF